MDERVVGLRVVVGVGRGQEVGHHVEQRMVYSIYYMVL